MNEFKQLPFKLKMPNPNTLKKKTKEKLAF